MFDSAVTELDAVSAAAAAAETFRVQKAVDSRQLEIAAHWADLHATVPECPVKPGRERLTRLGGEGTPEVAEFAPAELGPLLGTSSAGGRHLIADALDLRHRLPRLWRQVRAGQLRGWKARKVAQVTRALTPEQADQVDAAVAGYVTSLPWTRFETLLEARVMEADPAGAEHRAQLAEASRFVRGGRRNEHGLKLLVAKAAAGDVIWFLAVADRIAAILAAEGDADPVDVRRSTAIGILAQPALALDMLCRHAGDLPDEPTQRQPWRGSRARPTRRAPRTIRRLAQRGGAARPRAGRDRQPARLPPGMTLPRRMTLPPTTTRHPRTPTSMPTTMRPDRTGRGPAGSRSLARTLTRSPSRPKTRRSWAPIVR